jgi:hypothetical protein
VSDHVQMEGLVEWKGENVLHVHVQRGFRKCRVGPHIHTKG